MNKNSNVVVAKPGTSKLARPKFAAGMLLQDDDLDSLSTYTRDLSRLLFRSLFGCGVICGLVVKPEHKCGKVCITVGEGVALDCAGDPIHVPSDQTFTLDPECDPNLTSPLWVVLCATTKCCAPRTSTCSSDDDEPQSVCTRERDGFEIRVLSKRPECYCGCEPQEGAYPERNTCRCVDPEQQLCYAAHYAGKCGCHCEDDCGECVDNCVVLARLERSGDGNDVKWAVDHRVRRFIRPGMIIDPQPEEDRKAKEKKPTPGDPSTQSQTPAEPAAQQAPPAASAAQQAPPLPEVQKQIPQSALKRSAKPIPKRRF